MPREFLHEIVKQREIASDPWTRVVHRPRASWDSYCNATMDNMMLTAGRATNLCEANVPEHIVIEPQYRMGTATVNTLSADTDRWVAEFTPELRRTTYTRSNVRIGNLPISTRDVGVMRSLSWHATYLLNNHGCFPDYNVTSIINAGSLTVTNYTCAWCGQRFSGGD